MAGGGLPVEPVGGSWGQGDILQPEDSAGVGGESGLADDQGTGRVVVGGDEVEGDAGFDGAVVGLEDLGGDRRNRRQRPAGGRRRGGAAGQGMAVDSAPLALAAAAAAPARAAGPPPAAAGLSAIPTIRQVACPAQPDMAIVPSSAAVRAAVRPRESPTWKRISVSPPETVGSLA